MTLPSGRDRNWKPRLRSRDIRRLLELLGPAEKPRQRQRPPRLSACRDRERR